VRGVTGREAIPCEVRLLLVSESACFLGIWEMLSFLGSQKERRLCCECFARYKIIKLREVVFMLSAIAVVEDVGKAYDFDTLRLFVESKSKNLKDVFV
jgi:hypothetical protein